MTVRATTTSKRKKETKKVKTEGILAVDNGGLHTKVFSLDMDLPTHFDSRKGYGYENKNLATNENDMVIKWNDEIYFSGLLMLDSPNTLTGLDDTKTTDYFILNLLIAVAKYGYDINKVITDVPYSRLSDDERDSIADRLIGNHKLTINDVEHNFEIVDVEVVSEVLVASHAIETEGVVRWLDLGSRTVGYGTTFCSENAPLRPLFEQCGTIEGEGLDIKRFAKNKTEFKKYVNNFVPILVRKKWKYEDKVILIGGGAMHEELVEVLEEKFINLLVAENPMYVQVIGMLEFAVNHIWVAEDDDLNGEE